MKRPDLNKNISAEDFRSYYWLKEELVSFCRSVGIYSSGGKVEIANNIIRFLESGDLAKKQSNKRKAESNFDWAYEHLSLKTIITDNYANTENVRSFFKSVIGDSFKFNVGFMNWMKDNVGKTLGEAAQQWNEIAADKKRKGYKSVIEPQFEYNTYIREFLLDNPGSTTKEAIKYWKVKREKPGATKYSIEDLKLASND